MEILPGLVDFAFFTGIALVWAKWSKLDLGLRAPAFERAWLWILVFVAWLGFEGAINTAFPQAEDTLSLERMSRLSLFEELVLVVALGPLWEELLFRGAMFSALLRRWGIWVAAIGPSLLWGILHIQYELWAVASLVGSGIVLAIIRWKSGSLYPPLVLHAASNLLGVLAFRGMLGSAT